MSTVSELEVCEMEKILWQIKLLLGMKTVFTLESINASELTTQCSMLVWYSSTRQNWDTKECVGMGHGISTNSVGARQKCCVIGLNVSMNKTVPLSTNLYKLPTPISGISQALVFTHVIYGQCIIYIFQQEKKVLVHTHSMGWDTFEFLLTQIYNEHVFNLKCSVALSMK